MPSEEYHASPGLSASGLSDLLVSPLFYWHQWLNPHRQPKEPTACQEFGTALHVAVLEPQHFDVRYCQRLDKSDYPGCLDTMDELKAWLSERGLPATAKRKQDLIDRVRATRESVRILQVLEEEHEEQHAGKIQWKKDDWFRIGGAAQALRSEPKLAEILAHPEGKAEVSYFVEHPETGVLLKARMDWVTPAFTVDLKTFSNSREKPVDKAVTDAIWFNGYHRRGYFYSLVRALESGAKDAKAAQTAPPFVLAFVESDPPHEVRIRELRPIEAGTASLLWERARLEVDQLIKSYAYHVKQYGERPWRTEQDVEALADAEFPSLVYGGL